MFFTASNYTGGGFLCFLFFFFFLSSQISCGWMSSWAGNMHSYVDNTCMTGFLNNMIKRFVDSIFSGSWLLFLSFFCCCCINVLISLYLFVNVLAESTTANCWTTFFYVLPNLWASYYKFSVFIPLPLHNKCVERLFMNEFSFIWENFTNEITF